MGLPIRFNSIPKIGYLLALVVVLSGMFFASGASLFPTSTFNPLEPVSADELQYLALRGRIVALEVKLPAEGALSTRLKTYLAELKTELGKNNAILADPRNILSVVWKTRERNKEIDQIIGQIKADLGTGTDSLEVAGNEQKEIEAIFFGGSLNSGRKAD